MPSMGEMVLYHSFNNYDCPAVVIADNGDGTLAIMELSTYYGAMAWPSVAAGSGSDQWEALP